MNCQLDIKLEQFTEEEIDVVLKKIKSRKAVGLNEIPPEARKQGGLIKESGFMLKKRQESDDIPQKL